MPHYELLIDGHFIGGPCDQSVPKQVVRAPFDGSIVGTAAEGGWNELKACIEAAHDAFSTWRKSPRHQRQALLRKVAQLVREREGELSDLLTLEVGKPATWSKAEVGRLALTFDFAADLLTSYGVEAMPVDIDPRGIGYRCTTQRFPIGVVFCIVPYNWPYNLAAHKVAPALATGNTVVLKVSDKAPLSSLALARLIHEAGCPPGVLNAWNGPTAIVSRGLADPRVEMLSFTGSAEVGWKLKESLPKKRVALELGGNASAIVCSDANLDWACRRIVAGGYGYAGQVCIAVQHAMVAESIYEPFRGRLIDAVRECPFGDPAAPETVCGPLIDEEAAQRVQDLIDEAVAGGARVLVGGPRRGTMIPPTLLENVSPDARLSREEAFGPVLTLAPFYELTEAIDRANQSRYGIHLGVFTNDLRNVEPAFDRAEVGGVIVNDYPTLRFDNLPYGGVKESGFGREGVRFAMDEMTEPKALLVRTV